MITVICRTATKAWQRSRAAFSYADALKTAVASADASTDVVDFYWSGGAVSLHLTDCYLDLNKLRFIGGLRSAGNV